MIILGIDPGLRLCGFSVIKKVGHQCILLDYGCLKMNPSQSIPERLLLFYQFFYEKIEHYGVTHIALETPFLGKNAQNFLKLGYLRGVLYLLATQHQAVIGEFAPREVKLSLTGYGGASKEQVARVVQKLFSKAQFVSKQYDITDAVAVTLCGFWQRNAFGASK